MNSEIILKYYPNLDTKQISQINQLYDLYVFWNKQINVISRKDIDMLYERHILHSFAIAQIIQFLPGSKILDVGTGGGFPGIPLAILFPESSFTLVDAIGKKIKVVNEIIKEAEISNAVGLHIKANQVNEKVDFVISRAVTRLKEFYPWINTKFLKKSQHHLKNGVLYLKGGDLNDEILESGLKDVALHPIKEMFEEAFFETKFVVYFPAQ